jgi:hypothetical protein
MGIIQKIKDKIANYMKEKEEEKKLMHEIKLEAIIDSREDIKKKMKEDYVKKMTESKKDKLKKAFSLDALGDVNAKIDRMTGNTGSDKFSKFGNGGKVIDIEKHFLRKK